MSTSERYTVSTTKKAIALVGGVCIALAGCSAKSEHQTASPTSKPAIMLVPDMSGFLEAGSTTNCHNTGPRPCAPLIRTEPNLAPNYVNADPDQPQVSWPLESYGGTPGDSVTIMCHKSGELVRPYEGSSSSNEWYKVSVPVNHVANPNLATSHQAVIGWASIEWFNQSSPDPRVPAC